MSESPAIGLVDEGTPTGLPSTAALGLLPATSLPFIVTATQIGQVLGRIDAVTSAALLSAGLVSVLAFPLLALGLLRPRATRAQSSPALESTPSRRRQTRPEQPAQKSGHYLVAWE